MCIGDFSFKRPLHNLYFCHYFIILGILISNKSIKCLLDDLKREGCSFILTRKLNQDVLENLFSALKGMALWQGQQAIILLC